MAGARKLVVNLGFGYRLRLCAALVGLFSWASACATNTARIGSIGSVLDSLTDAGFSVRCLSLASSDSKTYPAGGRYACAVASGDSTVEFLQDDRGQVILSTQTWRVTPSLADSIVQARTAEMTRMFGNGIRCDRLAFTYWRVGQDYVDLFLGYSEDRRTALVILSRQRRSRPCS